MRILVLIPAYNCENQIGRVINQFHPTISPLFEEIMIIENKSQDQTINSAIKALKQNQHLNGFIGTNESNVGYGGTLKIGFNYAIEKNYDFIMILHGDDQGDVMDMIPYINDQSIKEYDCTLGARFHPKSKLKNYSWFRTFGNKVYNLIFSVILGKKILDLGSGINIYKLDAFREKDYKNFPNDLTFDYCGIISHSYRKRSVRFIPITWREDDQISNVKMISQSIITLKLLLSYCLNKKHFIAKDKSLDKISSYKLNIVYKQSV